MNYVGVYWTLPVLWADFRELPSDPDEAAKVSKTIRYQVARVRRWVKDDKGHLLGEVVAMDHRPDRGSDAIEGDIRKAMAKAKKLNAQLVLVDFSLAYGWRPQVHGPNSISLIASLASHGTHREIRIRYPSCCLRRPCLSGVLRKCLKIP